MLRKKNMQLEDELSDARRGDSNLKLVKMELKEAQREIEGLRQNASGNSNISMNGANAHSMVREYLERIESLQEENDNLKSRIVNKKEMSGMDSDGINQNLRRQVEDLKLERDELKKKMQNLQRLLEKKNNEIEMLRKSEMGVGIGSIGGGGEDSEAFRQLAERNNNLMMELNECREKIRKMEASFNTSYMSQSNMGRFGN